MDNPRRKGRYEWDFEAKELNKIGKKPAWSEEDETNLEGIISEIEANKHDAPDYDIATYDRFLSWLKSLKDRVRPKQNQSGDDKDALDIPASIIQNGGNDKRKE